MEGNLQQTIEELYEIAISETVQTHRGILFSLQNAPERRFLFRPSGAAAGRTVFTYTVLRYLQERRFTGVEVYLLNRENTPYITLNGTIYIAVPVLPGKECMLENREELERSAELLAAMHRASEGFTPAVAAEALSRYLPAEFRETENTDRRLLRIEAGRLPEILTRRTNELKRFLRAAAKSVERFDCAYAAMADIYLERADAVLNGLSSGLYARASEACLRQGAICHKDYTAHNILLRPDGGAILNFDQSALDIPVCDLANLIKRRMRKCGWNLSDAALILNAYARVRPLSDADTELLYLLLSFPQKLWRVVNKYYNSKKSWCEKSCMAKLAEIEAEEQALSGFLQGFRKM